MEGPMGGDGPVAPRAGGQLGLQQLEPRLRAAQQFASETAEQVYGAFCMKLVDGEKALGQSPLLALLVKEEDEERQPLPACMQVIAAARVDYHGSPRELLILRLRPSFVNGRCPAAQILAMGALLEDFTQDNCSENGPWMWPLHHKEVCFAILVRNVLVRGLSIKRLNKPRQKITRSKESQWDPVGFTSSVCDSVRTAVPATLQNSYPSRLFSPVDPWHQTRRLAKRFVTWLCMRPPKQRGPLLLPIQEHYGYGVAFSLCWSGFYAQQLWILAALSLVGFLAGIVPVGGHIGGPQSAGKVKFEVMKSMVVLWGIAVAYCATRRFPGEGTTYKALTWNMSMRPGRNPLEDNTKTARVLKLLFFGVPALVSFFLVVVTILVLHTQLLLHVIYVWGDCIELLAEQEEEEEPCRDPQMKHGFLLGWSVEVSCDILLALIFELIYLVGELIAKWIGRLREFSYRRDYTFFVRRLTVALALLDRIGFVFTLAFLFVPQWDETDEEIDCSKFMFRDADYRCLAHKLPVWKRRWLFEKLLKGPFVVAPFVALAMTTLAPWLAQLLHEASHVPRLAVLAPLRVVTRIVSLIFSYDGDSTGCTRFVSHGGPFDELVVIDGRWHRTGCRSSLSQEVLPPQQQHMAEAGGMPATRTRTVESGAGDGCHPSHTSGTPGRTCQSTPNVSIESNAPVSPETKRYLCDMAIRQVMHKPFEAADELQTALMSFVWVLFFSPIMPVGVFTTLLARIVGLGFIIEKLLYVRRRPVPEDDVCMHRIMWTFVNVAVFASLGWTMGLTFITYNDDLQSYAEVTKVCLFGGLIVWLGFSLALLFLCNKTSRSP